jgi:hypothetical protein
MGYNNKTDANKYWFNIKLKIAKDEPSFQLSRISRKLKLPSHDGKSYSLECFCLEDCLRVVMSIPSEKVEPLKRWMTRVAVERLAEEINPELAIQRGVDKLKSYGKGDEWVSYRVKGICGRNIYTDSLHKAGIKDTKSYAMATSSLNKGLTGMTVAEHKKAVAEEMKSQNLPVRANHRDNLTKSELAAIYMAEVLASEEIETRGAKGVAQCCKVGREAGETVAPVWDSIQKRKAISKKSDCLSIEKKES